MPETRLTRSETDYIIAGVCGGLASYLGLDVILVRLAFLVLGFASGIGVPIYLVLWVIMPRQAGANNLSNADVIQENIGEMGETVSSSLKRLKQPGSAGILLIILGVYFLLNQLGLLRWLDGAVLWPIVIIGLGFYLLVRRNQ